MNTVLSFIIEVTLTIVIATSLVRYLRPFLQKILTDLCGTEDRANFWTAFSNIILIGMPIIFALLYRPEAANTEELFFEITRYLSGNLGSLLVALIGVGLVVSFFALVAPRTRNVEVK